MRCFVHRDAEAVGVCRTCGRALCPGCAAEGRGGLSCRGRCEAELEATTAWILRTRAAEGRTGQILAKTSAVYVRQAWFMGVFGIAFLVLGLVMGGVAAWAFGFLAALLLVSGAINARSAQSFRAESKGVAGSASAADPPPPPSGQ